MFKVIFTSDYEIHGNGEGSPNDLIIEPTSRMIELFKKYNAKLTIMADIAEIMKFKDYKEQNGADDYFYETIIEQLKVAILAGHDVQLHIHPSYLEAENEDGSWKQNYVQYDLARLDKNRMNEVIKTGKSFLENLIKPVKFDYKCFVFRAANWSMQPTFNIATVLVDHDFLIDTSVFKYGKREGLVEFDYSDAYSDLLPWPIDMNNVCHKDEKGKLFEVPIYCENRYLTTFLTINRIYRVLLGRIHSLGGRNSSSEGKNLLKKMGILMSKYSFLFKKYAWKMDFNQCTGQQLIDGLKRAEEKYKHVNADLPFVLIGHSKLFTKRNEVTLKKFLDYVHNNPKRYRFGTFDEINLEKFR